MAKRKKLVCAYRKCKVRFMPIRCTQLYDTRECRLAEKAALEKSGKTAKKKTKKTKKSVKVRKTRNTGIVKPVTDLVMVEDDRLTDTDQMVMEQRQPDIEPLMELYKEAQHVRNQVELIRFKKFITEKYATGKVDMESVLGLLPSNTQTGTGLIAAALLQRAVREDAQIPELSSAD